MVPKVLSKKLGSPALSATAARLNPSIVRGLGFLPYCLVQSCPSHITPCWDFQKPPDHCFTATALSFDTRKLGKVCWLPLVQP